jgi:hypothetical protein
MAAWTAQQMIEAFPGDMAPMAVERSRRVYGDAFRRGRREVRSKRAGSILPPSLMRELMSYSSFRNIVGSLLDARRDYFDGEVGFRRRLDEDHVVFSGLQGALATKRVSLVLRRVR